MINSNDLKNKENFDDAIIKNINGIETKVNNIYIRPEDMDSWDEEDSTQAITDAIATNKRVILSINTTYIISSPIILKDGTWIEGQGFTSVIKLKDNSNCSILVSEATASQITIKNLKLDGNVSNQSSTVKENGISGTIGNYGISIVTREDNINLTGKLNKYCLDNIYIYAIGGTGLKIVSSGICDFKNIYVNWTNQYGMYIYTFDSTFYNLDASMTVNNGLHLSGANNRYLNCVGWYCKGFGIYIESNRSMLKQGQAQDCLTGGMFLAGNNNIVQAMIDSVGQRGEDVYQDNTPALTISYTQNFPYTVGNKVDLYVLDKEENTKNHDGHGNTDYLINITGTNLLGTGDSVYEHASNNKINIDFNNVRKGIFKYEDTINERNNKSNEFIISGTMHDNSVISNHILPSITSSITNKEISECRYSELRKSGNIVHINYEVILSNNAYGTVIGTVSKECIPTFTHKIICSCTDGKTTTLGTVNIDYSTGDIILDNIPEGMVKVTASGEYLTNK